MRNRYQRAVRRGRWKYLKVADREFLFDIEFDSRERGDLSQKRPDMLAELRTLSVPVTTLTFGPHNA